MFNLVKYGYEKQTGFSDYVDARNMRSKSFYVRIVLKCKGYLKNYYFFRCVV